MDSKEQILRLLKHIEGVISTRTHFVLKRYKESGTTT
jgi:type III secretory pathway lipoprotein EscJ